MSWEPAERVQKNDAGEFRALIGGEWVPVDAAQKNDAGQFRVRRAQASTDPTAMQKFQASTPMRVVQGMRDPIDAGAQFLAHAMPSWLTNALDYVPSKLRNSDSPLVATLADRFLADPSAKGIDQAIQGQEQQYQQARQATSQDGTDLARLAGNVVSPANAAVAKVLPMGKVPTTARMAGTGAAAGAVGGVLTPDESGGENYWGKKAGQVALGGVTGGVVTPVLGKLTEAIAPRIQAFMDRLTKPETLGARASLQTDQAIELALREVGADPASLPKGYLEEIRAQVLDAMKSGRKLDAAAMIRAKDFKEAGIQPLQGQLTRDATQFARERNLRAVPNVGEPIMQVLEGQNQRLQQGIGSLGGNVAGEQQTAGNRLVEALRGLDKTKQQSVSAAYNAARESSGKNAEIALQGISQDMADVARKYGKGNQAVQWAKGYLADLGIFGGKQTKVFTVEEAENALQALNSAIGNDKAAQNAASEIRKAIKKAITDGGDDVFAQGRQLAAERFKLHESVPALAEVVEGRASPDKFIQKHIINADTNDVKALAKALTGTDAFNEARAQLGAHIQRAAFGENLTGDKLLAPERLAKALREIGTEKLKIFFSPQEVEQLQRFSRVGAYINQAPAAAPVLGNPNMAWAGTLLSRIPGAPTAVQLAAALKRTAGQASDVNAALAAKIPEAAADLPPEVARRLALTRGLVGYGAGALAAGEMK